MFQKEWGVGGYLSHFGLWDWYNSQPGSVREFLYESCGFGIGTSSDDLIKGDIFLSSVPEDPYPWTATKFLCNHAHNAVLKKNHRAYHALIDQAQAAISSDADREYYLAVKHNLQRDLLCYPDQGDIEAAIPLIISKLKSEPGVLQVDFRKKHIDDKSAAYGYAYSTLVHSGKIHRVKKGRTFQIELIS